MGIIDWVRSRFLPAPHELYLHVDDRGVSAERLDGLFEGIEWVEVDTVTALITGKGARRHGVGLILRGNVKSCTVQPGVSGAGSLLDRLRRFPDFDGEALSRVENSQTPAEVVCWSRLTKPAEDADLPQYLHGILSTSLTPTQVVELFVRGGWLCGTVWPYRLPCGSGGGQVSTRFARLMIGGRPVIMSGPVTSAQEVVPALDAVLSPAGIAYEFESSQVQDDLAKAIIKGDVSQVRQLLASGADPGRRSGAHDSPLHLAVSMALDDKPEERAGIVRLLVEGGADVNELDNYSGFTPLSSAVCDAIDAACQSESATFNWSLVSVLLDLGADVHASDFDGKTPFDHASDWARQSLKTFLRERGATPE